MVFEVQFSDKLRRFVNAVFVDIASSTTRNWPSSKEKLLWPRVSHHKIVNASGKIERERHVPFQQEETLISRA